VVPGDEAGRDCEQPNQLSQFAWKLGKVVEGVQDWNHGLHYSVTSCDALSPRSLRGLVLDAARCTSHGV